VSSNVGPTAWPHSSALHGLWRSCSTAGSAALVPPIEHHVPLPGLAAHAWHLTPATPRAGGAPCPDTLPGHHSHGERETLAWEPCGATEVGAVDREGGGATGVSRPLGSAGKGLSPLVTRPFTTVVAAVTAATADGVRVSQSPISLLGVRERRGGERRPAGNGLWGVHR